MTNGQMNNLDVKFPRGMFTSITGVSGSGKSSFVSQVLVELLGHRGFASSVPYAGA